MRSRDTHSLGVSAGTFFKNVRKLTDKLLPMKKYLEKLHEYCGISGISMEQLALNYVVSHPNIDGVLIGVDNCQQLQANVDALQNGLRQEILILFHQSTYQKKNY